MFQLGYGVCVCLWDYLLCVFFFFKQKTAYEMRISDWSSDVCSSDPHHLLSAMLRSSKYRMDASAKTEICLRPGAELIHRSGWEWVIFMHHLRRIAVELVPGHHRVAVVGPDKDADRHQCLRAVPGERLGVGKRHHANSAEEHTTE